MKKRSGGTHKKNAYKPKDLRKTKTQKNKTRSRLYKGGNAFLNSTYTGFPARLAIPVNSYSTDIQHQQLSSRLDPQPSMKGGKSRKSKKNLKKIKGGFIPFSWINGMSDPFGGTPNNLLMTTGSESGGMMAYNLITNNASNNHSAIPVKIMDTHLA